MIREIANRIDSWVNLALGFGGVSDRIRRTQYGAIVDKLSDAQITAMYRTEHLSAKIVDVYPKTAFREGFEIGGVETDDEDDDTEERVCSYLRQWQVVATSLDAAIWGRAYGGAGIWLGSLTADPATPFVMGEKIDFLRVVDRRFLVPQPWTLDALGCPTFYDIVPHEGGARVGPVHASRLVQFPGAHTDALTKSQNNFADDSVLQRPLDALKSDGIIWNSAQQLISEASIGVLSIKGLYSKLTGPARAIIEQRLSFFNQSRSVARAMTLDSESESYKRENTTFAGVSDLSKESLLRVASSAEIPVSILCSEEPGGLNATGDASIRWWLMAVHAYRIGQLDVPVLYLCKALLAQSGIPAVGVDKLDALSLRWGGLWTPSETERADIRLKGAQADEIDIENGVATPDELALSHYGEDGYSQDVTIERKLRMPPTEAELEASAAGATGATGPTEGTAAPTDGSGPAGENVQAQVLNGTQVSSLVDIVAQVSAETIPRDAGVEIVMLAYQVDKPRAEALLGSAGKGFKVEKPPAPAPFGAKPGAPPPGGKTADDSAPAPEGQDAKTDPKAKTEAE